MCGLAVCLFVIKLNPRFEDFRFNGKGSLVLPRYFPIAMSVLPVRIWLIFLYFLATLRLICLYFLVAFLLTCRYFAVLLRLICLFIPLKILLTCRICVFRQPRC